MRLSVVVLQFTVYGFECDDVGVCSLRVKTQQTCSCCLEMRVGQFCHLQIESENIAVLQFTA